VTGHTTVGGVTIRYRELGEPEGAPVLLLHGGSSGAGTWARLTAALVAAGHRTVAADLRGHGGSSRTSEWHGLSTGRFLLPALSLLKRRRGFDARAVTSAVRQLRAPDPAWWERLGSITAPTLLVSGGPRSHISPARLLDVARRIPHAELVTIPVGHRVHSNRPDEFAAAVVPFLSPEL
jgi:pimeloyl-ACP methyl ester carboxylesterase